MNARHLTDMARTAWGSSPSRDIENDSSASPGSETPSVSDSTTASEDISTITDGAGLDKVACSTSSDGSGGEAGAKDKGAGQSSRGLGSGLERRGGSFAFADASQTGEKVKLSSMPGSAEKRAYVPLHGLIFLLAEMHMKTPEEILEKVAVLWERPF